MGTALADVRPGDWFVVSPDERLFWWIELGESLIDGRKTKWGHAGVATGRTPDGTLMIIEAEPHGAVMRPWHWEANPHLWSTGTGLSNPSMASAALSLKDVGYSFLDYVAIEAHSLHIPVPGLQKYIMNTGHVICSQLVDVAAQRAAQTVKLFDDGRWNGFVKPSDLGHLLELAHAG